MDVELRMFSLYHPLQSSQQPFEAGVLLAQLHMETAEAGGLLTKQSTATKPGVMLNAEPGARCLFCHNDGEFKASGVS